MPRFHSAILFAVGTIAAFAILHAPAKADPAGKECFSTSEVNGFNAPDNHTVYLSVGVKDIYKLDLMSDCLDLTFRESLGVESTAATRPWICSPLDASVVYQENGIPQECPVEHLHKLTASELAALPKRDKP